MSSNLTRKCRVDDMFIYAILPKESIKLFFGLILVALYVRVLYVLFVRRNLFSSAVYTFVIVNGFASLICYVSYFNIHKLPIILYFFGNKTLFGYTWLFALNSYLASVSRIITFEGIFCMSLNRCSLIMNLPNANYYWEKWSKKCCFFYCVFPMVQYFNTLFSQRRLSAICFIGTPYFNHFTVEAVYYFESTFITNIRRYILFAMDLIIWPGCLVANILSVRSLFSKRKFGAASKKTVDKHSQSLLNMCILEFVIHSVVIFFDIATYYNISYGRSETFSVTFFSSSILEFTSLLSCLVIVVCSPSIRKEVFDVRFPNLSLRHKLCVPKQESTSITVF